MIFKHYLPIFASTLAILTHAAKSEDPPKPAKGKAFDHIFIIFLENTNYALAASDPYLQHLSQTAITLTNYHALTHPSQPNYIASIGGDYYGLNNDLDTTIPANYTTIVDLLEPKHLTWKTYQEDMPDICYTAPQAPGTVDAATGLLSGDGLYFRKHNPFVIHESIAKNATRCRNVVPASQLALDFSAASPPPPPPSSSSSSSITSPPPTTTTPLPNYMYFTPNMIHDGHNTTVRDASLFLSSFLPPLLASPAFISSNTLVVITFDETEDYTIRDNLIYTLLLGSNDLVIPQALKNTTDNTFYTHYSLLSTVESNWDLGNLGRNDANNKLANVFKVVADKTGYKNFEVASQDIPMFNDTVPGFLTGTPHVRSSHSPPHTTTPSHANNIHCVSATLLMTIAYLITTIGTLLV